MTRATQFQLLLFKATFPYCCVGEGAVTGSHRRLLCGSHASVSAVKLLTALLLRASVPSRGVFLSPQGRLGEGGGSRISQFCSLPRKHLPCLRRNTPTHASPKKWLRGRQNGIFVCCPHTSPRSPPATSIATFYTLQSTCAAFPGHD